MNSHEYGKKNACFSLKNANTQQRPNEQTKSYTQCDLKKKKKGLHWLQTEWELTQNEWRYNEHAIFHLFLSFSDKSIWNAAVPRLHCHYWTDKQIKQLKFTCILVA